MKMLGKEIKAVIFDMDGTLIDSTGIWQEIDEAFFARRNMVLPSDYSQKIVHLGLRQAAIYTKDTYNLKEDIEQIIEEWHEMSVEMYHNVVRLKPHVLSLLDIFKKNNIKMAIATANDEQLYLPCLKRLGIEHYFDFIADVNDVKEGKNSAKIYLYLAEKLKIKPENIMVIEDVPTCIKTAFESGFITIAVADPASKNFEEEKRSNSDLFVDNFEELINLLQL